MFKKFKEWRIRQKFTKVYNAALEQAYNKVEECDKEILINATEFYPLFKKYKFDISLFDKVYCLGKIIELMEAEFKLINIYTKKITPLELLLKKEFDDLFPEFAEDDDERV